MFQLVASQLADKNGQLIDNTTQLSLYATGETNMKREKQMKHTRFRSDHCRRIPPGRSINADLVPETPRVPWMAEGWSVCCMRMAPRA